MISTARAFQEELEEKLIEECNKREYSIDFNESEHIVAHFNYFIGGWLLNWFGQNLEQQILGVPKPDINRFLKELSIQLKHPLPVHNEFKSNVNYDDQDFYESMFRQAWHVFEKLAHKFKGRLEIVMGVANFFRANSMLGVSALLDSPLSKPPAIQDSLRDNC